MCGYLKSVDSKDNRSWTLIEIVDKGCNQPGCLAPGQKSCFTFILEKISNLWHFGLVLWKRMTMLFRNRCNDQTATFACSTQLQCVQQQRWPIHCTKENLRQMEDCHIPRLLAQTFCHSMCTVSEYYLFQLKQVKQIQFTYKTTLHMV